MSSKKTKFETYRVLLKSANFKMINLKIIRLKIIWLEKKIKHKFQVNKILFDGRTPK